MLTPNRILANKRYKIADSLIPDELRGGYLLDLGCGYYNKCLKDIKFTYKAGIDIAMAPFLSIELDETNVLWMGISMEEYMKEQFDNMWDVILMLAVLEHIDIDKVEDTFKEIYRILKPGGRFILTTPSPKSKWILKLMHWNKGHKKYYSIEEIIDILYDASFLAYAFNSGYFELGLNQYIYANKHRRNNER